MTNTINLDKMFVIGTTEDGITLVALSGMKKVYDFGEDYGCLVSGTNKDVSTLTDEEVEIAYAYKIEVDAERVRDEKQAKRRSYRRW